MTNHPTTGRPTAVRRWAAAVGSVLAAGAAGTCRAPTAPLVPPGTVRIAPHYAYRQWWAEVEACAGRKASFDSVAWYLAPGDSMFTLPNHLGAGYGMWVSSGNRIVLVRQALDWPVGVRHEMLHAVLRVGGHPRAYFLERCRGLVYCGESTCVDRVGG